MDIIEQIAEHFNKPEKEIKSRSPEGVCPVCWGYQEYDRKIRTLFKDDQIDVIHHKKKFTRIRKFLMENIEGIQLIKPETCTCPKNNTDQDRMN